MIDAKIPKDIRAYKAKLIGPFTARQLICLAIMAASDILLYSLVFVPFDLTGDFMIYALIFIDIPIAAFGWVEPQGIPLEKYLKSVLLRSFLVPTKRKAKNVIYKDEKKISEKNLKKNREKAEKKGVKAFK
ncbi:PrgI family protein [Ruminococcus sp. CLA-AA-H200]|uniref:PrgI family protein n=1 Tax=Ruminococcus turbiniformis TaxID=2881258 RepID=A0ABS8FX14_9FIRM|nr:PrgI family protein [Ruminococcus turbiniformis]MCC2254571.1 PrgI family protein [Ruminococcus turbiniformis]